MSDPNSDSRTYTELCDKAQFLMDVNRHAEAVHILTDAVRSAPDRAPAYIHLAWCHRNLKNPADSLKFINRAVEAEPENPSAHRARSLIMLWLGKSVVAYECAAKALSLDAEDIWSHYVFGLAALHSERDKEAHAAICHLFVNAPNWYHTHELNGWANLHWHRPREAEMAFRVALSCDPESAEMQEIIGRLCVESGRVQEGAWFFESSIQLDPTNRRVQQSLKDSRRTMEQNENIARALASNPNYGVSSGTLPVFVFGFIMLAAFQNPFIFVLGTIFLVWLFFFFRSRGYEPLKWPTYKGWPPSEPGPPSEPEPPSEASSSSGKFLNLK